MFYNVKMNFYKIDPFYKNLFYYLLYFNEYVFIYFESNLWLSIKIETCIDIV
jgi:hypothetical protein